MDEGEEKERERGDSTSVLMYRKEVTITIFNPRHMREGYGSRFVCVCASVTELAATYLVFTSKVGCH